VRAVLFDFYGTLAEKDATTPSWESIAAELGYELAPEALRQHWDIDGQPHEEHSRSREHYVAWQHARLRTMLEASGVPAPDDDVLFARILASYSSTARLTAYDDAVPVLTELRSRGAALAICSNWDWDLREAIAAAGLTGLVDVVVSSAWVGVRKPHPHIYERTLTELGVDGTDAVFVGDTWSCDVDGPRREGMRPVYIRRPHFGVDFTAPPEGAPSVPDLRVLLELVQP
jgi:putative hydrolase of the HAD superfamily